MPKWEITPFEQFPQTPEVYLEQLEQELVSIEEKKAYVLSEKERILKEMEGQDALFDAGQL